MQIKSAAIQSARGERRQSDEEHAARVYNSTILDGQLRSAICCLTSGEGGGVMEPNDLYTKKGVPVVQVLQ